MQWTTSLPDWEQRILAGQSLIPCPPLFPDEAQAGLDVMRELRIVDAPGSPKIGDASAPWLMDFAGSIFGAYDPDSGRREIREFMLLIPKKNAKSTGAAAIMLTLLIRNWRMSAELIILAPTKEVADNAFAPARDMIKADPELTALMHVQDHVRTITHRGTNASLKVVAADSNTVGGKKGSFILVDELHLFGTMSNAENMLREATGGLASRPEGCIIYLTTQSDKPPAGVFLQKLQYARGVRDGRIDDKRFLPVLYEFPQSVLDVEGHRKPENFGIVNPNLGYSVDPEYLQRELVKAEESGMESLCGFMSKFLNVEIGVALRSNRWAGADFWEGAVQPCTLDELIERSEVITLGIDGGGLDDLLGLYVIGRDKTTQRKLGWGYGWAHPSVMERRKEIAPALQDFEKDGHLTLVSRVGEDIDELADIAERVYASGLLDKIGCDPAGIGAILDRLVDKGIPEDKLVGVSQGWKLGGAIKTAERWLADGTFSPADQPVMAWCVGNARVEPRANSIMITKQASGSAKIDVLMAMFNAVTLMALNPAAATKKYQMFVLG